jgi:SAM-dependent methyltransferase
VLVSEAAIARAWKEVEARFPFRGYLTPLHRGNIDVARTVSRYLPTGSRILDFGAGPADKTALLASLGYKCIAMDDLADEWHKRDRAREMILRFAADMGIEFIQLDGRNLPPTPEVDMVMLHSVLQHLHDSPRDLLVDLVERIRPEGYLFITVPNHVNLRKRLAVLRGKTSHAPYATYYWYPGGWRGYVREYTRGDCVELAKALALDLVEVRGVHHMLCRLRRWQRPVYVALTRFTPSVRDTWLMVARKPAAWAPQRELADAEFRRLTGLTSWSERHVAQ